MISENKITIRSAFKITKAFLEPAPDPKSGRLPECVRQVDSNNNMITKPGDDNKFLVKISDVIEIYDGKVFNLDDEIDAAYWDAIKYSKRIAQDRFQRDSEGNLVIDGNAKRYGIAEFYIERAGFETHIKNTKKREVVKALSFIHGDTPDSLYQKARVLERPMTGLPISDVEDYLTSIAEKTPNVIIELYTGNDVHLKIFLLDALDKRVIYKKSGVYYVGDIFLGVNDTSVINFFKNPANKTIYNRIKQDTYPELMSKVTFAERIVIPKEEIPSQLQDPAQILLDEAAEIADLKKNPTIEQIEQVKIPNKKR